MDATGRLRDGAHIAGGGAVAVPGAARVVQELHAPAEQDERGEEADASTPLGRHRGRGGAGVAAAMLTNRDSHVILKVEGTFTLPPPQTPQRRTP